MLNERASKLFQQTVSSPNAMRCQVTHVAGTPVIDAGTDTAGSLQAGLLLARLCMGDSATISLAPADRSLLASDNVVHVQTDDPLRSCLGAQYAGWPIQAGDFFAMGSGPMRMLRGREEMLQELNLTDPADRGVGVLESDRLPSPEVIKLIAEHCGVPAESISLAVAPSTSIAGSLQVVARSIETALHKLHELKFDVRDVVSATGAAPLPPPAKAGDTVAGIGRTNDSMLYGATVSLWVDCDDEAIDRVAAAVPSCSSRDHGKPFAKIFKQYDYDFYQVDPLLFSPAVVTLHNLRSGRSWTNGKIDTDVLRQSFDS
ncbi:MAG: methenyltetrahydromethanopterin cyclohydrolase [Pirellulales bacterium]|nr:methenyltetrahydromethanopterin cyclohydrolase [Pirellulales bacterium]